MRKDRQNQSDGKRRESAARPWLARVLLLCALLVLPLRAAYVLVGAFDVRYLVGYFAVVSVAAFYANWSDKRKAEAKKWRTPESVLHWLELAGGWPAAYIAQRLFRHKTAKGKYQFVFWVIVLVYQYSSFDYIQSWKWSRGIYQVVRPLLVG